MVEYNLGKVRGEDGKGIESINKIDTTDNVDTYEIVYTNGDTQTYTVTNGRDGTAGNIDDNVTQNSQNPVKSSGIYTALTGKANTVHTHTKNQITDFPEIPDMSQVITKSSTSGLVKNDGSIDTTSYLSSLPSHTHTKSQISDFSHTHTKSEISDFTHSHSISDVTNLQSGLNAKANSSDLGTVATSNDYEDLDNIPTSFNPSSHTHTKSEITDFSHSHSISDVTDLQTNLNAKVNVSDIANNLTTTASGKVLDARQGKALKDYIDGLVGDIEEDMLQ